MRKIIGVTVGTPLSVSTIKEKINLTADEVKFSDGESFQQKYDSGELRGPIGTTGAQGEPGVPGEDGFSPTASVATIAGGHRVTITDVNGSKSFDVMDGKDGSGGGEGGGADGADGVTFYPNVDADGNLSWTNDGGLTNPDPVNIKGPAGATGADGQPGKDGETGPAGYTPVKGTDYWTAADKAEMVQETVAAIPTPDVSGQIGTHNADDSAHGNVKAVANAALPKAGGTMTGAITLHGEPTEELHAVPKKYVDEQFLNFEVPSSLPEVTASDNGKFLRVVDGAWAAESLQNAEEVSF